MKFVYQVSILGDDKLFAKIVDKADKNQQESIQYRGQEIELNKAKAIVSYLDMYNRTTDDLLRR